MGKLKVSRVVEYTFFFGLLALAGFMVWTITKPFLSALALSAIIVTICYPLYERIIRYTPRKNATLASLVTTLLVLIVIVLPVFLASSLIIKEAVGFYQDLETGNLSLQSTITLVEGYVNNVLPGFTFNMSDQASGGLKWLTGNLGSIFAGTLSTILIFMISLIGTFYFFRDGKHFVDVLIKVSPLSNSDDEIILSRLTRAVRAVATGTVLTALIQGTLVSVGFSLFGIERAILWGSLASLTALVPGIGTTIVTVPAVIYLFVGGDTVNAFALLAWSMLIVGMVDNLIAPYLIGRGNNLHPFIVLISVLGGVLWLGPIGFVIGPVIVTLFIVLLEIYNQYIIKEKSLSREIKP